MDRPLHGIRVLSMEQAAALPFATRHLADLGAEVIRVQSHRRGPAMPVDPVALRDKRQLALDLSVNGGSETFLRVAAHCDVVAHNFTPRVVRQFGIDYDGVRAVNEAVIYVSLTGFGTTGPWAERPLFGPGAEALSGHNLLIGDPDAWTPGRPGTITYVDNVCGLNTAFAVLAALDERDRGGRGQHIDISLYETAVAQLGVAVAERAFGAPLPVRVGNEDRGFALHAVFDALGHDAHVAITAHVDQLEAAASALGVASPEAIADAVAAMSTEATVEALQAAGIAAAVVADAAGTAADPQLWARGYFGNVRANDDELLAMGPAWGGGGEAEMQPGAAVGADTRDVLSDVAGMTDHEIDELFERGVAGTRAPVERPAGSRSIDVAIERRELSRVDEHFDGWRGAREASRR